GDLGQVPKLSFDDAVKLLSVDADLFQDRLDDAFRLGDQGRQQMQRVDLWIAAVGSQLLRALHRVLGLDRELVEAKCHFLTLLLKDFYEPQRTRKTQRRGESVNV